MKRAGPLLFFAAATMVFASPLSLRPAREALDLGPDTRLFLWTLGWDLHALSSAPLSIFDANIFHPETSTLAYSEHQIGSALLAAPVVAASRNLLLGMNAVLLLSTLLCGLFAYFLGRQVGLGRWGALLTGVIFAFAPPRFFRLGQLHLATVQWIPLCLALVHRYARSGTTRHLLGAAFVFWLQALSGGQGALFLALATAALVVYLAISGSLRPQTPALRDSALALLLACGLNLPFVLPYLEVRQELGLSRGLDEAALWSPNRESFLASPAHLHRWAAGVLGVEHRLEREAKAYLFPGLLPLVLSLAAFLRKNGDPPAPLSPRNAPPLGLRVLDGCIVALLAFALVVEASGGLRLPFLRASGGGRALAAAVVLLLLRLAIFQTRPLGFAGAIAAARSRFLGFVGPRLTVAGGFYCLLAAFSLWASLGPAAGLYSALHRLVPGFDFVRVPSRLGLLTILALAVLGGIGFERLRSRSPRLRSLSGAVVLAALAEFAAFPLPTVPYSLPVSPMDRYLAEAERSPVAAFPIPDPRDAIAAASRHSLYMLHSREHFLPLVNGYSGFTPPFHDRLFRTLAAFPSEEGLAELEALGVRYAVFHRGGYDAEGWRELLERLERYPARLEVLASFEEGKIYELTRNRRDRGSSGASRSRSSSSRRESGP